MKTRQAADIVRIENAAANKVRLILQRFQLNAIRRAARGDVSQITQKELDELVRVTAAALAAADALARRRVAKFSIIDDFFGAMEFFFKAQQIVTQAVSKINTELTTFTRRLATEGLTTQSMMTLLAEKMASLGITPRNPYAIENIVRTQTQIHYGAAKFEEEQEDYVQDILWGYRYSTVGDVRVRPEHAVLEGVTLPKDDPFWQTFYPPNGWSCRCQAIPLFSPTRIKRPRRDVLIEVDFAKPPTQML